MFIVIEGLDGAGTTTQTARLAAAIRATGRTCHTTREPSDGPIGVMIRQALRRRLVLPDGNPLGADALALLFAADRVDHIRAEVHPATARGDVVVSDRYVLSSIAYQGVDLDPAWVAAVNAQAPPADLTLLLDVPADTCMRRIEARGGAREIFEHTAFLERVRRGYDRGRAARDENVVVIDGEQPVDAVAAAIWAEVAPRLAA